MKNKSYILSATFAAAFTAMALLGISMSASAQAVDIGARQSVYFTGSGYPAVITTFPYVNAGKTMELKAADAVKKSGGQFIFNLGIVATREFGNLKSELKTTMEFKTNVGTTDMEIRFPINQQVVEPSLPIPLKAGLNKVIVIMDPANKIAESNENNNNFTVFFNVIDPDAPPVKHPPIRIPKKVDLTTTGQILLLNDQKGHKAMDPQNDFIMKEGASVKLLMSKAGSCGTLDGVKTCNFWVGFTGIKNVRPDLRAQTEYAFFDNGKKRYGLGMDFLPGVTKFDTVFKLNLVKGDHDIKIMMDPSNHIIEEDENNNAVSIHVLVVDY
jgi:hypothetical protein